MENNLEKYMNGELRSLAFPIKEEDKMKYVLTGIQMGTLRQSIGRLVQVRKGAGVAGTDLFLIRESDGTLTSHHNQCLWIIPEEYNEELDEMFNNVKLDDPDNTEYSIEGKNKCTGFMIYTETQP
ncbi:TPA: hypothetical protein ACG0AP_003567 [Elizabethkingia anophelis]